MFKKRALTPDVEEEFQDESSQDDLEESEELLEDMPEVPTPSNQAPKNVRTPVLRAPSGPIWELKEQSTQSVQYIYNNRTKEKMDVSMALIKILNILEELR